MLSSFYFKYVFSMKKNTCFIFFAIKKQLMLTVNNVIIDLEFIKINILNNIITKLIIEVKGFFIKR